MIKILFICHGNICRSPMAEFVMKDLVRRNGCGDLFLIGSRATSSEEIGNGAHYGTVQKLRQEKIPMETHRAQRLRKEDYGDHDYLIGMDEWNRRDILQIVGGDPEGKVALLLDFTDHPRPIADPWYTGDFDETYADIREGCGAFYQYLEYTHLGLRTQ